MAYEMQSVKKASSCQTTRGSERNTTNAKRERKPVPEDTEVIGREEIGGPAGGKTGEEWNH